MQTTDAIAFEAAAALDAYEEQLLAVETLTERPHAAALLQAELRRVCEYCASLPQLAGASLALLLAHHRLLAQLARRNEGPGAVPTCFAVVQQCVATLQRGCRQLFLAPHLQ